MSFMNPRRHDKAVSTRGGHSLRKKQNLNGMKSMCPIYGLVSKNTIFLNCLVILRIFF